MGDTLEHRLTGWRLWQILQCWVCPPISQFSPRSLPITLILRFVTIAQLRWSSSISVSFFFKFPRGMDPPRPRSLHRLHAIHFWVSQQLSKCAKIRPFLLIFQKNSCERPRYRQYQQVSSFLFLSRPSRNCSLDCIPIHKRNNFQLRGGEPPITFPPGPPRRAWLQWLCL